MTLGEGRIDVSSGASDIERYFDYLYKGRQGYVCVARRDRQVPERGWREFFYNWPTQRNEMIQWTIVNRSRYDVYCAPALFNDRHADKESVIGAPFLWADIDVPIQLMDGVPPPTLRIATGSPQHEHWYWRLSYELTGPQIDLINQALTYHLGTDKSGWNSNKVLRPPDTFNHKVGAQTAIIDFQDGVRLDPALFSGIPAPPARVDAAVPETIPPVEQVVAKYQFSERVYSLFARHVESPGRSTALMELGYSFAEMGLLKEEILALLMNADERWGKFKGRSDRMTRLMEMVEIAIAKHPPTQKPKAPTAVLKPIGFKTLLATEIELDWQWDQVLTTGGFFMVSGPPGVGKTQFSLDAAGHMALGKPFLERAILRPLKVGFFSLEMNIPELKYFLNQMKFSWSSSEQDILEEMLQLIVVGEPLYMIDNSEAIEQIITDLKLDVMMVDSLGSATDESVSSEAIKRYFHWNDMIRNRYGVTTWYVHHHRKASGQNKKPNSLDDIYGDRSISKHITSSLCLWDDRGLSNVLSAITLKNRFAVKEPPFVLLRDSSLHFVRAREGMTVSTPVLPQVIRRHPGGRQVPAGQQGATQGVSRDLRTGGWSTGPATLAELDAQTENEGYELQVDFGEVR